MLKLKLVSKKKKKKIIKAFDKLKARKIMKVADELHDETRLAFEHTVVSSFGIDEYFDKIKASLLSMQETRATVKE